MKNAPPASAPQNRGEHENSNTPAALLNEVTEKAKNHAAKDYLRYITRILRSGSLYWRWRRIQSVFSPALWITRILRVMWRVFTVVETSAFLLVAVAIVLLALPIALLLSLAFATAAIQDRRRANRRYAPLFCGRRVLAFFPERESDFSRRMLGALAGEYTVLLVGERSETRDGRRIPFTRAAVRRADGVLLVRTHYYFYLRRTLLNKTDFFAAIF